LLKNQSLASTPVSAPASISDSQITESKRSPIFRPQAAFALGLDSLLSLLFSGRKQTRCAALLSLVFLPCLALAQAGPVQSNYPATVNPASGAPSGNCPGTNVFYVNTANGNLYDCPVAGSPYVLAGNTGTGGTVSANSGTAGATGYYPAAGGSTTVGPDPGMVSNGTGGITLGGAGVGAGSITVKGSTSGSVQAGCVPATSCSAFGTSTSPAQFKSYGTGSNCSATGSAANPSLAACGTSAAGAFSCSTSASTGTCVVSSTTVTASSEIIVTPVAAANGLTCNAVADTGLTAPRLLSQSAGVSFTINLGTFTSTAECFYYTITN
jgi:hypothetical protein